MVLNGSLRLPTEEEIGLEVICREQEEKIDSSTDTHNMIVHRLETDRVFTLTQSVFQQMESSHAPTFSWKNVPML